MRAQQQPGVSRSVLGQRAPLGWAQAEIERNIRDTAAFCPAVAAVDSFVFTRLRRGMEVALHRPAAHRRTNGGERLCRRMRFYKNFWTRCRTSYQKTVGFPTYDLLAAAALRMEGTDEEVAAMRASLDPENLTGSDLDRYIFPRSGIERRQATFAEGIVHVTGTGTVQQGDLFASGGGVAFQAAQTVTITGEGDVPVICRSDGAAGKLPAHSITQMPVTIQGITACDNPEPPDRRL